MGAPAYKAKAIALVNKIMRALCLNIRAGSLRGRASLPARNRIPRSYANLKQTVKFVVLLMYHLPSLPVNLILKNDSHLETSRAGVGQISVCWTSFGSVNRDPAA